jgi:hypothetical protein
MCHEFCLCFDENWRETRLFLRLFFATLFIPLLRINAAVIVMDGQEDSKEEISRHSGMPK